MIGTVMPDGDVRDQATPVETATGGRTPIRAAIRVGTLRRRIGRAPAAMISGAFLIVLYAACFLVPVFLPESSASGDLPFLSPSAAHLFGTDSFGRDVFVRTFAAGRLDITVAVLAVAFSMFLGTLVGSFSATSHRVVDSMIMRAVDALIAFPYLVTILLLVVIVGPNAQIGPTPRGLTAVLVALLALGWTFYARIARGQALSIRNRDYVVAASVLGYSRWRILFRHVVPGVLRVVIAYAVSDAIVTMGALASFAFLGVGVQPPIAEWGAIMYEGRAYMQSAWWIAVFPGVLLTLTGLALSVLADSLNTERRS